MTQEQIIAGFKTSLNDLIPNISISDFLSAPDEINKNQMITESSGFIFDNEKKVFIWFTDVLNIKIFFKIERKEIGLSKNEIKLIELIPQTINELFAKNSKEYMGFSLKYSSKISFGDILIAKFLNSASNEIVNNQLNILLVLQDLSFKYYEDKKCSGGFVFTDQPEDFKNKIQKINYKFYPFEQTVKLDYSLFNSPAAFRYVDGRNSYYLIDNNLEIHGVLRLTNPDSYSLVARIRNLHLKSLFSDLSGNHWVSFIGLKEEVYVIVNPDLQLKWTKNHWRIRDRRIIFLILEEFGLNNNLQELFVSILFALSEIGYGAGVLIADDNLKLPKAVGKIDQTEMGGLLRNQIQSMSIVDLNSTNSLLGIISSDGLTTISRDGLILSCGDIIDISEAALLQSQGGGRSQAAIAASFFGLSIKISQNGPMSFFHQGKLILQF